MANTPLTTLQLADGAVGCWPLDEASGTTAVDAAGHSNGTYLNGPTIIAGAFPGAVARSFNGTNQTVRIPHVAALNLGDTFTIEAWIQENITTGSGSQAWFTKNANAPQLGFDNAARRGRANIDSVVGDWAACSIQTTDPSWHHYAVTKAGTARQFYRDGIQRTVLGTNGTALNNSLDAYLMSNQGLSEWANCGAHNVAIYPTVLSATQIAAHAQAGFAGTGALTISHPSLAATGSRTIPNITGSGALAIGHPSIAGQVTPPALRQLLLSRATPASLLPLDETSGTAANSLTGSNHGVYHGGVGLGQLGRVPSTYAAQLDGVDDYIHIPHHASLNGGDKLSIVMLVELRFTEDDAVEVLWDKGTGAAQVVWNGATKAFEFRKKGTAAPLATANVQTTSETTYVLLGATKNGATSRLYLGPTNVTTAGTNATLVDTTTQITIGSDQGSSAFAAAIVQFVGYYPGVELTAQDFVDFNAALDVPYVPGAATGGLTISHPSLAGSGSRTLPVFSGSGGLTIRHPSLVAFGAATPPLFLGSGAPTIRHPSLAGTGSRTLPQFSGSGGLTITRPAPAGSGAAIPPPITASGALAVGHPALAGAGSRTIPQRTGTGTLTIGHPDLAGTGSRTLPPITGSGALTVAPPSLAGTGGSATPPDVTASGDLTISHPSLAGNGFRTLPQFNGIGAATIAKPALAGTGSTAPPVFIGSGALTIGHPALAASGGGATPPTFSGSGGVTFGGPALAAAGSTTPPLFAGSGGLSLGKPALAAAGVTGGPIGGSGGLTIGRPALEGSGETDPPVFSGSGGLALMRPQLEAAGTTGLAPVTGAGGVRIRHPSLSGAGQLREGPPAPVFGDRLLVVAHASDRSY